jgi:O-acetyl-ADP-ribose deacetylase (regulator of RNase III)
MHLTITDGNIVASRVDAVVNAANTSLARGGGVDGALRSAAGPGIEEALSEHRMLAVGTAIATPGFRLPARYVIHTVVPRWRSPAHERARVELFEAAHHACLTLAAKLEANTLAFPAIGTGAFAWPAERAADAAFGAIADWVDEHSTPFEEFRFVCPTATMRDVYGGLARDWLGANMTVRVKP